MLTAISEKTGWSTSLLLTIAGGAVTIALTFANVSDRVISLEAKQAKSEQLAERISEQQNKLEIRTQRNEDNYAHILETMGEIRSDVKTLKARVR